MPAESLHVPPQALDAEMAVLACMLIEREAVEKAIGQIDEGMFYKEAHRKIFRALLNLYERGEAADILTVGSELDRLKWTSETGGKPYLVELCRAVTTAGHVESYAKLVREKAVLRDLIRTATGIVADCHGEEKDAAHLLDEAQRQILGIAQKQALESFRSAKDLAHEVYEDMEKLHQHRAEVTGVATGFKDFDKKTSGLQKGDLILIAARPGQGKTSLALNIAANVALHAKEPKAVGIFSLEMSKKALMQRMVAAEARVDLLSLRSGYYPRDRWTNITTALERISEAPLFFDDSSGLSVLQVRTRARRLAADLRSQGKELSLILIDYLQLMQAPNRNRDGRQQEVAEISRGLKQLARDLELPVVALSQLSRKTEEKGRSDMRPQLSDLRESGALEQDADLVAMIYREGYYKREDQELQNKAELIIAKQRNGPTGTIHLHFELKLTRFDNATEASEPQGTGGAGEEESFDSQAPELV